MANWWPLVLSLSLDNLGRSRMCPLDCRRQSTHDMYNSIEVNVVTRIPSDTIMSLKKPSLYKRKIGDNASVAYKAIAIRSQWQVKYIPSPNSQDVHAASCSCKLHCSAATHEVGNLRAFHSHLGHNDVCVRTETTRCFWTWANALMTTLIWLSYEDTSSTNKS